MVAGAQSCFTFLAAGRESAARQHHTFTQLLPHRPKTRVGVFPGCPSGRLSRRSRGRSINTPGSRGCAYKTASGRHEWPNRDPLGERGGLNLYDYVGNNPINRFDRFGLQPVDVEPPSQGTYGAWNDVSGRDLSDINNEMNHYEPGESGGDPISSLLSLFQSTPPPTPAQIQWDLQYGYTQPPPGQTWLIPARPQNPPKPQQKSCPNGGAFYAPPTSGNINAPPTLIIP